MQRIRHFGNMRSAPLWMVDDPGPEHVLAAPAKIDVTAFTDYLGTSVVVAAGAAAGATSITVDALTLPMQADLSAVGGVQVLIPAGSLLSFGTNKFARTTADANVGATSIAVAALPTALVIGDTARYSSHNPGGIFIPAGTLVGRTYAERAANQPFGPADVATPDDEIYLTAFDVVDGRLEDEIELYRHTSAVKENYLPNWSNLGAPAQALIRELYQCITGVD